MKSIISIKDLSYDDILLLCTRALTIIEQGFTPTLSDKILASLFFEPSTRTKLSFETAGLRAGAKFLNFQTETSSLKKGESLEDTIRMASTYADIVVIRHPEDGAAARAKNVSSCPIINAGDGKNEHPTQTLLDLLTILRDRGSLENFTITLAGDLKYSRTIHSLVYALTLFDVKIILASPKDLTLPEDLKTIINDQIILETSIITEGLNTDYFYMTRVQKERFPNPDDAHYEEDWILTKNICQQYGKKGMKVMHPLPRVNEISTDIDDSAYQLYFTQAENGLYMRTALLEYTLGIL